MGEHKVDRIDVWQCIGCGKMEAPQPCIGVCQDRKAQLVYATDYDALAKDAEALRDVVRRLASITPRPGEFESSYIALQRLAREVLGKLPQQVGARERL